MKCLLQNITSEDYKRKRDEAAKNLTTEVGLTTSEFLRTSYSALIFHCRYTFLQFSRIRERINNALADLKPQDDRRRRPTSGSQSRRKIVHSEGAMAVEDRDTKVFSTRVKALEALDQTLLESLKVREEQANNIKQMFERQENYREKEETEKLNERMREQLEEIEERSKLTSSYKSPPISSALRAHEMASNFMNQSYQALKDSLEQRANGGRGDKPIIGLELSAHRRVQTTSDKTGERFTEDDLQSHEQHVAHRDKQHGTTPVDSAQEDGSGEENQTEFEDEQFENIQAVLASRPDFEGVRSHYHENRLVN